MKKLGLPLLQNGNPMYFGNLTLESKSMCRVLLTQPQNFLVDFLIFFFFSFFFPPPPPTDPSVTCFESDHKAFLIYVLLGVVAYVILIPAAVAFFIIMRREKLYRPRVFAKWGGGLAKVVRQVRRWIGLGGEQIRVIDHLFLSKSATISLHLDCHYNGATNRKLCEDLEANDWVNWYIIINNSTLMVLSILLSPHLSIWSFLFDFSHLSPGRDSCIVVIRTRRRCGKRWCCWDFLQWL